MSSLHHNEVGGISYAPQQRFGEPELRAGVLAELRMTIDALCDTAEHHTAARATIMQLVDMLVPGEDTDALRQQLIEDLDKIDALMKFNDYIIARVRSGTFRRMAELFDR